MGGQASKHADASKRKVKQERDKQASKIMKIHDLMVSEPKTKLLVNLTMLQVKSQ